MKPPLARTFHGQNAVFARPARNLVADRAEGVRVSRPRVPQKRGKPRERLVGKAIPLVGNPIVRRGGRLVPRGKIPVQPLRSVAREKAAQFKRNDQVRFELAIKAFAPDTQIIAPWRIWSIKSREEEIEYAEKHNIPLKINRETNYSKDKNLWHLSHEGLDLEDPANEPQYNKPDFLEIGKSPEQAPDKPTYITISFEKGIPVAVDGEKLDGVTMIEKLNKIGGENGVGLADIVENRLVGMKSRGVYENPAGAILYRAHEVLETLTLDRDTMHYKEQVALRYAELVYFGQWLTPLREALAAFVDKTQERVTGDVKLKLYKGNIINAGTTSPYSLYSEAFATFDEDDVYDQKDSAGFINLFGLPIKVKAILDAEREAKA